LEADRNNGCGTAGCNVLQILEGKINQIKESNIEAIKNLSEKIILHVGYMKDLADEESSSRKEDRRVDTEAVAIANVQAIKKSDVLATQVTQTATTIAQQLTVVTTQLIDRIAALEKAQYESIGKAMSSPDIQKMVNELIATGNVAKGKSGISNQLQMVIVGVICSSATGVIVYVLSHLK
jgi:hypothetical protein